MNWKLGGLLLLCGFAGADRQDAMLAMKSQAVIVTNEGFLGGGRGSGVLLDAKHVLTCAHMARSWNDELFVYTYPLGQVIKAHPEHVDVASDLMMLVLDDSATVTVLPTFENHTYDGEPLTVVGNALGSMHWYVTTGVVSSRERFYVLTDAAIQHGNSGGPWFDEDGHIVAITDWGLAKDDTAIAGVAGGISGARINETLEAWANPSPLMQPLGGN